MTPASHPDEDAASCGDCPLHPGVNERADRRDFLRRATTLLVSAGLGFLHVRDAHALPDVLPGEEPPGAPAGPDERRYPIPATDSASADRDNSLIIARAAGRVYAFSLACPHQNTALRWEPAKGEFRCPKHKSRYRPDGTFIDGRATRSMDRLPIRREGQQVVVDLDTIFEQDAQPALWAGAFVLA